MMPPQLLAALLNWRVWAALYIAVALAASHWRAYTRGELNVQTKWDADKLAQAEASLQAMADKDAKQAELQANADKLRRTKNAQIDRLNADLAAALSVDYTTGATTITAYATDNRDFVGTDTYGLGVSYDLGGGAAFKGGVADDGADTVAEVGMTFAF